MTKAKLILIVIFWILAQSPCGDLLAQAETFGEQIAEIRYQITLLPHAPDAKNKKQTYLDLIRQAKNLTEQYPDRAEAYVWEGIALSAYARYTHNFWTALKSVHSARKILKRAIEIDPKASGGAGYNSLAMLYYKVPPSPIGFRDRRKAREYFLKAIEIDSNLDTHYRYGEFLLEQGETEEGMKHLQVALEFPDRPGRREDEYKKQEIEALTHQLKGKNE